MQVWWLCGSESIEITQLHVSHYSISQQAIILINIQRSSDLWSCESSNGGISTFRSTRDVVVSGWCLCMDLLGFSENGLRTASLALLEIILAFALRIDQWIWMPQVFPIFHALCDTFVPTGALMSSGAYESFTVFCLCLNSQPLFCKSRPRVKYSTVPQVDFPSPRICTNS